MFKEEKKTMKEEMPKEDKMVKDNTMTEETGKVQAVNCTNCGDSGKECIVCGAGRQLA